MSKYFYPLVENPYRKKDINNAIQVLRSTKITSGPKVIAFENKFKKKIKVNNSLLVNSGSSANLLALQCLINPYRKKRLKQGDEVILPALCWSTSLWPIVQSGFKPIFADVDKDTLNFNLDDLKRKISSKTKAIMVVHVLGNCTNMDELIKIKKKNNLVLIEDTCESLGTKFRNKYLGSFGEFSSFSFYSSHQISSGEGGMICCKNPEDYEIIKALRSHGWSRGLKNENKIARKHKNLDSRFIFYNSGFNLRSTDIAASIGLTQFQDLDKFIKIRNNNRKKIIKAISKNNKIKSNINVIIENKNVKPSWFGIPILLKNTINKKKFIKKIEKKGVETRPIISGNFLRQPSVNKYKLNKKNRMKNSEYVNKNGFFVGLSSTNLPNNKIKKLIRAFETSL